LRLVACARPACGQVFFLCRYCDHGHRYCGARCADHYAPKPVPHTEGMKKVRSSGRSGFSSSRNGTRPCRPPGLWGGVPTRMRSWGCGSWSRAAAAGPALYGDTRPPDERVRSEPWPSPGAASERRDPGAPTVVARGRSTALRSRTRGASLGRPERRRDAVTCQPPKGRNPATVS
jgi:hypothetical protein